MWTDVFVDAAMALIVAAATYDYPPCFPGLTYIFTFGLVRREHTTINSEGEGKEKWWVLLWCFRVLKPNQRMVSFLFCFPFSVQISHVLLFICDHSDLLSRGLGRKMTATAPLGTGRRTKGT